MVRLTRVLAWFVCVSGLGFCGERAFAEEIRYIEDFALAANRAEALKQLVPGTEDYYYFHALYYQQTEQFDKVPELVKVWIQRHGETARVREIQNRQALLTYPKSPQQSLEYLRNHLSLVYNHQRERLNEKPNLPVALDQNAISRAQMAQRAYNPQNDLSGFEDRALEWMIEENQNPQRLRALLSRLQRPDYANLPKLIVQDVKAAYSGGFGSLGIHQQLLLSQLEECLKLEPGLRNQTHFVNTYLTKLQPNPDLDWRNSAQEKKVYFTRLWDYVATLAPVHNSLKAHVLYHRLEFDRSQGVYDKDRFLAYLKLPRPLHYVPQEYLNREENRQYPCDLSADFQSVTLYPAIGQDEPLVRDYLAHFFREETTWKAYEDYVNDLYLKHLFTETKIVNGLGDEEQWASLLPPELFQALKERIDLEFAPTNKTQFAPDDVVSLDLDVKNVGTLIVKVFEINTKSYYRQHLKEIDTDINLDGLVPNFEETLDYAESPLRRVKRHFEFPKLTGSGTFVIDFIGNGKSSRVLVRKGRLHYLVRSSIAGQVFTVLGEKNQIVPKAALWLGGHEYKADDDGEITVPFSNQPGTQPIVLCRGEFCSFDTFTHEAESYELRAGFYLDRESLLKRRMAKILIRPQLLLNGTPAPLSVLENVELHLVSTDYTGVASTKVFSGADVKLDYGKETVIEFRVPERLVNLQYTLQAKVKNLSQGQEVTLAAGDSLKLNLIEQTEKTEQLLLAKVGGEYLVSLLGKTGEALPDRAVQFSLKHQDFKQPYNVALQTDDQGFIRLGKLLGIDSITATSPTSVQEVWTLNGNQHTEPQERHGQIGEPLEVAFMTELDQPKREEVSLLELRGGTFYADHFDKLTLKDGILRASKLPRGDFDLLLKTSGQRIHLRVTEGQVARSYVLGDHRHLELQDSKPLQISQASLGEKTLDIQLQNAGKLARVHVFATRYQPAFSPFGELAAVRPVEPLWLTVPDARTSYIAGRNIGDEYRYIIERKYAQKFPGNMLNRPSLLLNPWAIRKTETTMQEAQQGDDFGGKGEGGGTGGNRMPMTPPPITQAEDFPNLDFLADTSAVLVNLKPDENGKLSIPREQLGAHQEIHIVAIDEHSTVSKHLSLPSADRRYLDLRLVRGFDPEKHFTQQKHISILKKGDTFTLSDISTARFENYDSLAKVYGLYATLSGDAKLREFRFLLDWPTMKPEEKRARYSEYASHELNYFLFKKDPEFFAQVVRPYLANKKNKTFLDQWLVGADLSPHLKSWEYHQLNVVERILLSQRIQGEAVYTLRHIQDLNALIPPNAAEIDHLFAVALSSSSLESENEMLNQLGDHMDQLEKAKQGRGGIPDMPGFGGFGGGEAKSGASRKPADNSYDPAIPAPTATPPENPEPKAEAKKAAEDLKEAEGDRDKDAAFADDLEKKDKQKRSSARQFYRALEKTQEWVENNYYHLPIAEHDGDLITPNPFWTDFAAHDGQSPFYSEHFAEASRNFPEMMYALAVLDLPFQSPKHETEFADASMKLKTQGPMIVLHEEIEPAKAIAENSAILVNENFFRHDDRYRYENSERFDKFITEEFLIHTVYGCQVVVTNPTSSRQKLDLLLQIPVGAIPVLSGKATNSVHLELEPFHTGTLEYAFYFPAPGEFSHYPVQVARNEEIVAHGKPTTLKVVAEPSQIDRHSWPYLSQYGSDAEVLEFLENQNLERINLDKIAFRMQDKAFFTKVLTLLSTRYTYNGTLWSYGIHHDDVPAIRQYLQRADNFIAETGDYLDSPLLTIDPVARRTYEHRDYRPLVNARQHPLGRRREILNDAFHEQYHHLLKVLSYHRSLNDEQRMAVTYYMLLQDRIAEAIAFFNEVNPDQLETRLQYDYFAAYIAMYRQNLALAEELAAKHANHPVDRWRNAFASVSNQLNEIKGGEVKIADEKDQGQQQTKLAATETAFDFTLEGTKVVLRSQNLKSVRVNYYLMDIELLFSRNPFVTEFSGEFSAIRPNQTQTVELPEGKSQHTFEIPEDLHRHNVLVEIVGAGHTETATYYANSLSVQIVENYGHLKVRQAKTGQLESKVYVKVYARMKDGREKFYKDGYTDLRGMFDYVSLSTDELANVDRFAILVLSEDHGAIVRETAPPKQ